MPAAAKSRSVTFSGCWTCKKRKVKCDEKPPECGNCTRMGIECGGYGVRLRWRDESTSGPSPSNVEGRGKIKLDTNAGSRYSSKDIDAYLLALDNDSLDETPASSVRGPFCMFPHLEHNKDNDATGDMVILTDPDQGDGCGDAVPPHSDDPAIGHEEHFVNHDSPADIGQGELLLDTEMIDLDLTSDVSDLPLEEYEYLYDSEDTSMTIMKSLSISSSSPNRASPFSFTILPMDRISISLSNNPFIDMLMHHYITNVSDILLPVRHARNPYRNIYAPAALEVVTGETPNSGINFALYNSLLASSAFHLWHCNPALDNYYQIGREYNERAVRHLRSSISSTSVSATDYRDFLMTILSLVDNSLFTGGKLNFEVHIRGATEFRKSQGQGRTVGANTQQLNEISAFFSLIEGTSSLRSEPSPWPDIGHCHSKEEVEFHPPKPGFCFEFQFGITPKIATAIEETCRLADHLSYYTTTQEAIPSGLRDACDSLDQLLSSWTLGTEAETSLTSTDPEMLSIFINQANAWYGAALIYNQRRIHHRAPETLVEEIVRVAYHLHAAEDVKAKSSADIASRAAPMTWPAFVASCDAGVLERETWRKWWERVQCYGIANYRRQWDIVQQIWDARDLAQGDKSRDWMDIIRDSNIEVLLL